MAAFPSTVRGTDMQHGVTAGKSSVLEGIWRTGCARQRLGAPPRCSSWQCWKSPAFTDVQVWVSTRTHCRSCWLLSLTGSMRGISNGNVRLLFPLILDLLNWGFQLPAAGIIFIAGNSQLIISDIFHSTGWIQRKKISSLSLKGLQTHHCCTNRVLIWQIRWWGTLALTGFLDLWTESEPEYQLQTFLSQS